MCLKSLYSPVPAVSVFVPDLAALTGLVAPAYNLRGPKRRRTTVKFKANLVYSDCVRGKLGVTVIPALGKQEGSLIYMIYRQGGREKKSEEGFLSQPQS